MTANKTMKSLLLTIPVILLAGAAVWFVTQQRSPVSGMRHVVLISLDTCRADYLSCYGYAQPTTPNIDALAREGLFVQLCHDTDPCNLAGPCFDADRHYSAASW